ncbi:MAG: oligosaccharide flippase family protein, partial [Bacteroidota bacterium]
TELKKRFLGSTVWTAFAFFFFQGLTLVTNLIVSKFIGAEHYGIFSFITTTAQLLGLVCSLGIHFILPKVLGAGNADNAKIISYSNFITKIFAAIAIIIFIAFNKLAIDIVGIRELPIPVLLFSALLIYTYPRSFVQTAIITGLFKYKFLLWTNLFKGVTIILTTVISTHFFDVSGAIIGFSVSFFVCNFITDILIDKYVCHYTHTKISIKNILNDPEIIKLIKLSVPAVLTSFVVLFANWFVNRLMLGFPGGLKELGVYNMVNQLKLFLLFIPFTLVNVITPLMSAAQHVKSQQRKILIVAILVTSFFNISFCIITQLFSSEIMNILGDNLENYHSTLSVSMWGTYIYAVTLIMGSYFIVKEKMMIGLMINTLWSILFIAISYYLIYSGYGSLGIAWSNLISYVFLIFVISFYIFKFRND